MSSIIPKININTEAKSIPFNGVVITRALFKIRVAIKEIISATPPKREMSWLCICRSDVRTSLKFFFLFNKTNNTKKDADIINEMMNGIKKNCIMY